MFYHTSIKSCGMSHHAFFHIYTSRVVSRINTSWDESRNVTHIEHVLPHINSIMRYVTSRILAHMNTSWDESRNDTHMNKSAKCACAQSKSHVEHVLPHISIQSWIVSLTKKNMLCHTYHTYQFNHESFRTPKRSNCFTHQQVNFRNVPIYRACHT